jgi:signal transduction histidine kinase
MGRRSVTRVRTALDALEHIVGGLATAVLAVAASLWLAAVTVASTVGVGLLLLPGALVLVRAVADRERARLSRWGPEIVRPGPVPHGLRAALTDPAVKRELGWVLLHGTSGFAIGLLGLALPLYVVQHVTFPFWWWLLPAGSGGPGLVFWSVDGPLDALAVSVLGLGWAALIVVLTGPLARLQAWPGRRLLSPAADADLSLRVAQLSATRAAALDAHATELRRIERSLHDGTQNRLVAVTVLLGAARRSLARDPATADAALGRAQEAVEQALAELRAVARSILPPVLADRGLAGAVAGLAASCGVPCRVDMDVPGRCAASVEATAYFVVAEALTNVSRHSAAAEVAVTVRRDGDRLVLRVHDDGWGGADESGGSGLAGIRRRVEAHDGLLTVRSPHGGPTTIQVELPCGS